MTGSGTETTVLEIEHGALISFDLIAALIARLVVEAKRNADDYMGVPHAIDRITNVTPFWPRQTIHFDDAHVIFAREVRAVPR